MHPGRWPRSLRWGLAVTIAVAFGSFVGYEVFEQPTNQIFGHTVTSGPRNQRVVALTFDDGPNPPYTDRILDVLEREHVHATFFVVGRAVQAYPQVVRREVADGDAIGNHTWDHRHLIVMRRTAIGRSLTRTQEAIYAAAHVRTTLMRPPFGARDWMVMQSARKLGYTVVMWSVPLARDWEYPPASVITQRVLPQVTDGSIIVLHDGNRGQLCHAWRLPAHICDRREDIGATLLIVQALKRRGFRFVTIPELIALKNAATHTAAPGGE